MDGCFVQRNEENPHRAQRTTERGDTQSQAGPSFNRTDFTFHTHEYQNGSYHLCQLGCSLYWVWSTGNRPTGPSRMGKIDLGAGGHCPLVVGGGWWW